MGTWAPSRRDPTRPLERRTHVRLMSLTCALSACHSGVCEMRPLPLLLFSGGCTQGRAGGRSRNHPSRASPARIAAPDAHRCAQPSPSGASPRRAWPLGLRHPWRWGSQRRWRARGRRARGPWQRCAPRWAMQVGQQQQRAQQRAGCALGSLLRSPRCCAQRPPARVGGPCPRRSPPSGERDARAASPRCQWSMRRQAERPACAGKGQSTKSETMASPSQRTHARDRASATRAHQTGTPARPGATMGLGVGASCRTACCRAAWPHLALLPWSCIACLKIRVIGNLSAPPARFWPHCPLGPTCMCPPPVGVRAKGARPLGELHPGSRPHALSAHKVKRCSGNSGRSKWLQRTRPR